MDLLTLCICLGLTVLSIFATYLTYCFSSKCWPERVPTPDSFGLGIACFNLVAWISSAVAVYNYSAPDWLAITIWLTAPLVIGGALAATIAGLCFGTRALIQWFFNLGPRAREERDIA